MTGLDLFIGAPGHFAKGNSSSIAVGAIYSAKDGQLRSVMFLRLKMITDLMSPKNPFFLAIHDSCFIFYTYIEDISHGLVVNQLWRFSF